MDLYSWGILPSYLSYVLVIILVLMSSKGVVHEQMPVMARDFMKMESNMWQIVFIIFAILLRLFQLYYHFDYEEGWEL